MFQAILLSGTEMASPDTRKKFELTTKYRVITGAVGKYQFGDKKIPICEFIVYFLYIFKVLYLYMNLKSY